MYVDRFFSLAESQRRKGKKNNLFMQWTRFVGCKTSIMSISNNKGEVKTSHPLVQSIKSPLTGTQSCQEEKISYHCGTAPLRVN